MSKKNLQFILPNDSGICLLECKAAFSGLSNKEKLYAHYLAQASWYGSLICLYQTSLESPGIFLLMQKLFTCQSVEEVKQIAHAQNFSDEDWQAFLIYVAGFYGNMGNYKSFGDTKFVPDLTQEKLEALILNSRAHELDKEGIEDLWSSIKDLIFSLTPRQKELGLGSKGVTTYFSSNCDTSDAELAQRFLMSKDLSAYNTRLFKCVENGKNVYEVRLASCKTDCGSGDNDLFGTHQFIDGESQDAITFHITCGDYSPIMQSMVQQLMKAKENASNENEANMIGEYIKCFTEGSIKAHKDGSRYWIRNKGPIIETYIGFIESYRDPFGVRGEFEGFVAMVNKDMSAKFGKLVDEAEHFLPLLPWPSCYEKDIFLRPDFTSLDVLAFGSSGIPAGINIPNYDDIRQSEGFKNVSLGNVLSSGYKDTKVTFLKEADKDLFTKWKAASFEVQVGLHELLGHGSGKLFIQNEDGTFNFDTENTKHTETGEKINSWYACKETWDSKFSTLSSSYEECRAECVGIFLCLSSDILKIFGHEGEDADNIIYINWLNMVRAGLCALEFYTPETGSWRQAHMQARYVILRVLIEAGNGLITIQKLLGDDGQPDVHISIDRSKINTVGKTAIGDFLRKLQVYKATADFPSAKDMYDHYSAVTDAEEPHFLSLRTIVMDRKQPRKLFVQCNTKLNGETVELIEYENTAEGLIHSFCERFPDGHLFKSLQELWNKDKEHFVLKS